MPELPCMEPPLYEGLDNLTVPEYKPPTCIVLRSGGGG